MDKLLCGVVTEKQGDTERLCTYEAAYAYPLTGDGNEVEDGFCLCDMHSKKFDDGGEIIVATRKGDRVLVQLTPEAVTDTMETSQ